MNSPLDSYIHSPFCFLSSLVAPSSTPTLASGVSSSEFPYHWEWVYAFLVVVVDLWLAGFLGCRKDHRPLALMPGRALPTSAPSEDSFLANITLCVSGRLRWPVRFGGLDPCEPNCW